MSPMMWFLLFFYFIILFLLFNILNYFNFSPSFSLEKTENKKITNLKKSLNWKW
uniref:ATP synthase F0 subunit 8 n=1 Tax=Polypedilum nubifer TaxID=54969 RepID=UPI001F1291AA|nr:ATP synthase F0 subunit 8 [Polypedilum nubifer]UKO31607.1 ATP synthase F0 subunit 8 [Polypedilum nubifer]